MDGGQPSPHVAAGIPPAAARFRPLFLVGPTAVGKTELSLRLAERLGGEIISVDSMQVYRGLDIGTAKPSPTERARVPHHLLDVVELTDLFDAAQFLRLAQAAVAEIQQRERIPILCGGTGLYFKVFLEGLGQAPPADSALRASLRQTPLPELLQELSERDPVTFDRIDRQNPRRVIRAVEVIRLTGKPFSAQRLSWPDAPRSTLHAATILGLTRSPEDLRTRIDARVDEMFQRGLVAETEQLLQRGLAQNETAMQALGYRQVVDFLQGVRSLPETIELVKRRTRHFAKRQLTWFRRQLPVTWIPLMPSQPIQEVLEDISQRYSTPKILPAPSG